MTHSAIAKNLTNKLPAIAKRMENKRFFFLIWLLLGIGVASFIMTFFILYLNPQGIDIRYTVICGALLPSTIIYLLLNRLYMKNIEKNFTAALCKAMDFTYCEQGCFPISTAERHKILPEHNKSHPRSGLKGSYRGTPLAIQEAVLTTLKQDPQHKNKSREFLRFWGLLVRIQLSRPLEGHTVVIPHRALRMFFYGDFSQYKSLKFNDDRFSDLYDIKATDRVDAKFILNPLFRDQLIDTGKVLKAYWLEVSFRDSEALLAFQRFRPLTKTTPLWKPIEEKTLEQHAKELGSLFKIIDVLKNNQQISL